MSITYTTVRPSEYYDEDRYSDEEESDEEESDEEEEEGPYFPQPVRYRSMQSKIPPQFMQHRKEHHHHHNRGDEEEEGQRHRYAKASYDFPYRSTGCSAPVLGTVEVEEEDDEDDSDDE